MNVIWHNDPADHFTAAAVLVEYRLLYDLSDLRLFQEAFANAPVQIFFDTQTEFS